MLYLLVGFRLAQVFQLSKFDSGVLSLLSGLKTPLSLEGARRHMVVRLVVVVTQTACCVLPPHAMLP